MKINLEQFGIQKDYELKDADHQRQFLGLLKKVDTSYKSFEALNYDIKFITSVIELLSKIKAWSNEEIMLEIENKNQNNHWDFDRILLGPLIRSGMNQLSVG
ncbi:hypothetical protein COT97_00920 [Candidatus Falkowbacteria bacterium CG10_big_fil_rev_8_21_14_0_10_39_11]|uniref:Uncharacterized protein n=1 Tax=Candidatus Falkowbacteria bacterium CG10_big_fil_rev_8_21_14_0_10_39_11 TaxID=1974565 RepID=A0A2H0V5Y7_9BACT|nr:MAG: hypothetical protein COT97_00920 [Candidatus Falkowbacteria bacterium CG10_big_fil_rev_8_21_14_0_10_39_11]